MLETAREMLGRPAHDWLVPHLNGKIRLEKPPLAYWLTAAAYKIFGVGEGPGRVPAAVGGWLTVGLTFLIARWLFGPRAGFFAAGVLFSSFMFFRFTRLAETDTLATLFVTMAVFCFWRGTVLSTGERRRWIFYHAASAAAALAVLAKGPPAAFAFIFFILLAVSSRNWRALRAWLICGAPLTFLAIALPWFLYIHHLHLPEARAVGDELRIVTRGVDHPASFWIYFPALLWATAPWTPLVVAAVIWGFILRRDARVRGLLLWSAAVFVPLCVIGQKQPHYLMLLLPPLAILTGGLIDSAANDDGPPRVMRVVRIITIGMVYVLPIAACVLFWIGHAHSAAGIPNLALFCGLVSTFAIVWKFRAHRNPGRALGICCVCFAVLSPVFVGLWLPSVESGTVRPVADALWSHFGDAPFCFYGPNESLPLGYALRRSVPRYETSEELQTSLLREPRTVVIAQTKNDRHPPPLPAGLDFTQPLPSFSIQGQVFQVYVATPPAERPHESSTQPRHSP